MIGLVISFVIILYLVKKKVPIGIAIFLGGINLALFASLKPLEILKIIAEALSNKITIEYVLDVVLITILSSIMQASGVMDEMVKYIGKIFKSTKVLIFLFPTIISAFNTTGSAVIAAPIIDSLGDNIGMSNARKSAVNLYIRHVWYYVLPFSVNLINASYISGISLLDFIKVNSPIALICFLASYFVHFRPLGNYSSKEKHRKCNENVYLKAFIFASPILVCLILVFFIPLYTTLFLACLISYLLRVKEFKLIHAIANNKALPMVYAAIGVMIFKNILENIPGLKIIVQNVINIGIPLEIIIVVITLFLAYVAANVTLVVSLLYPVILPLVALENTIPTAMLIFITAYSSYLISPVHMCQALTIEYFQVSLRELYKEYRITVPIMLISTWIWYLILV